MTTFLLISAVFVFLFMFRLEIFLSCYAVRGVVYYVYSGYRFYKISEDQGKFVIKNIRNGVICRTCDSREQACLILKREIRKLHLGEFKVAYMYAHTGLNWVSPDLAKILGSK